MKHIAAIVCNNGLGHLKRVLSVIERITILREKKYHFSVFFNQDKIIYFQNIIDKLLKDKKIESFDVKGNGEEYEKEFIGKYRDDLINADFIWSDNYIFPLKFRPDTLLTGSFLWLDMESEQERINDFVSLLKQSKPIMIGIDYFATENVLKYTDFLGVGIYEYYEFELLKNRNNLLISFGRSPAAQEMYINNKNFICEYIRNNKAGFKYFIEPEYFDDLKELPGVFKAGFSEDMYRNTGIAVIRPGIGTVCSVLSKSGHIISIYEKNNFEMENNATTLRKMKVGETAITIEDAFEKAGLFFNNREAVSRHSDNVKKLKFGGLKETALKIIEVFEK